MVAVRIEDDSKSVDNRGGANGEAHVTGQTEPTKLRGFATLDPASRREVARQGGRAAHAQGRAHEFTSESARRARGARGKSSLVIDPPSDR